MGRLPLFELVLQPGLGEGEGLGGAAEKGGQHQGLHLGSRLGTLAWQKIILSYYLHTRHGDNIIHYLSIVLFVFCSVYIM